MININLKQLDLINYNLKNSSNLVSEATKGIFKIFCNNLYETIKDRSPVDKGTYRDTWNFIETGENEYTISSRLAYSEIMETGSTPGESPWPNEGPRTVNVGGKIWSNQRPEPVAGGAVDSAKWEKLSNDLLNSLTKIL